MFVPERLLNRAKRPVGGGEPYCSRHLVAVGLYSEHDAGANRLAVEQCRASTADAVLTAQMRAGES